MDKETPLCPECNAPMERRLARRGPNAGRSFWGCTRYPKCKGTRDGDEGNQPDEQVGHTQDRPIPWTGPLLEQGGRVLFAAGGGRLGIDTFTGSNPEGIQHANLSNWCLVDHAAKDLEPFGLSSVERQVLGVVRKLLTRGRRPVVSPRVEETILAEANLPFDFERTPGTTGDISFQLGHRRFDRLLRDELLRAANPTSGPGMPRQWELDSTSEKQFFFETFRRSLGQEALAYLHPQVHTANLLPSSETALVNARVDFLFTPPGSQPLVIEVDGAQHQRQHAADASRDEILRATGYPVVRLSTRVADEGHGAGWDAIHTCWDERGAGAEAAPWAVRLLWQPALVTRVQLAVIHAIECGILGPGADRWELRFIERDLPVAGVAMTDFWALFGHVERLYGTEFLPGALSITTTADSDARPLVLGDQAHETGLIDWLDLDVSAFTSYLLQPTDNLEAAYDDWGDRPLLEIRAANIPRLVAHVPTVSSQPAALLDPDPTTLRYFLQTIFRKQDFRGGQLDAVSRTLTGQDTLVLLPTGAGKSLIYQLTGLLLPGVTMIIDPIISLIEDQLYNLAKYGIDRAVGISSLIEDPLERQAALLAFGQGDFLFCLVAPERLQTPQFRSQCRSLSAFSHINLWVVDEAHCVSEWGHEFRTAYLNLGRVARDLARTDEFVPPLLGLTGTASRAVLRDVQRELQITAAEAIIRPESFDRPELNFAIIKASSREKQQVLVGTLQRIVAAYGLDIATFFGTNGSKTLGGLVFCPHVNGAFGVVDVAQSLREAFRTEVNVYAGQAPKGWNWRTWNRAKSDQARRFKENEFPLLVCTKAFGMGIDKPNIRYTVHFGIPGSLEAFYQEAGRAGRDRQTAHNYVLFSDDQPERASQLLDPDFTLDKVRAVGSERRTNDDDVGRMLFFHLNAFAGVEAELNEVVALLGHLGTITERSISAVSYPDDAGRAAVEKAIHRLHLLGIVEDYTLDYAVRQFELYLIPPTRDTIVNHLLQYAESYNMWRARGVRARLDQGPTEMGAFVRHAAQVLLEFVYEAVERGRRTALREMYRLAQSAHDGEDVRRRLLEYLQDSKFSQAIEELPAAGAFAPEAFEAVLEMAAVPSDASEMRGATIRQLESLPDSPSLLLLRGFLEFVLRPEATEDLRAHVTAGLRSLQDRYGASSEEQQNTKADVVRLARQYVPAGLEVVTSICVEGDPECARKLLRHYVEEAIVRPATNTLLRGLSQQLNNLADVLA